MHYYPPRSANFACAATRHTKVLSAGLLCLTLIACGDSGGGSGEPDVSLAPIDQVAVTGDDVAALDVAALEEKARRSRRGASATPAPTAAPAPTPVSQPAPAPAPDPAVVVPPVVVPGGAAASGFVYRDGRNLMLDGRPFKFVGFNDFSLTGCHTGNSHSEAAMDAFFAMLRPRTVTRTWAFESSDEAGIDRVVRYAEKHGQKVLLVLHEGAGHCSAPHYDANWYRNGYSGSFFNWVKRIVPKYKDSPAVMWEISNEPGQASGGGMSQADMKKFYHETAQLIKSLDPNHVVSTGTLDSYQAWQLGQSGYADVHNSPYIDLVSMHEYEYDYNGNMGVAGRWGQNLAAAKSLNKPIFIGEFGAARTSEGTSPQKRADVAKSKYDAYLNNEAAGVLYWAVTTSPNNGLGNVYSMAANESYTSPVVNLTRTYTHANLPSF
jgi:mannan endo-1,4-beta-mannosidase